MLRALDRWRRHPAPGQLELALPAPASPSPPPADLRPAPLPEAGANPPAPADAPIPVNGFLGRLRDLGLRGIRRCTLTANRSTVVSFRGDGLRVHRAFVGAPEGVLQAIVRFVNGRGAVRRQARRALLAFEIPRGPSGSRPTRRRRPSSHPDDVHLVTRLSEAHQQLNRQHFAASLGEVAIRVSRRMRSRLGHYSPGGATAPEIAIARRHLRRDGWASVLDTLAHEMVHQWQHETARPLAHDRDFRRKAREVGIGPHAKRPAGG
jgi:hypothetical protein